MSLATGIMLDPVYTGKAVKGLVHELNNNADMFKGHRILYLHTGMACLSVLFLYLCLFNIVFNAITHIVFYVITMSSIYLQKDQHETKFHGNTI